MKDNKIYLMTLKTKHRLEKELVKVKKDLHKAGQRMGEAAGPESDWHDNSAWDFAVEDYKVKGVRESYLQDKIDNAKLIEPHKETGKVDIGNTVVVRIGESVGDKKFTILGTDDPQTGKSEGWISYQSPLGKTLMDMRPGRTKTFSTGEKSKLSVTLKSIHAGEF